MKHITSTVVSTLPSVLAFAALLGLAACSTPQPSGSQSSAAATAATDKASTNPKYDAVLAKSVGADDHGMRSYVFVLLKTGPNKMAEGPARNDMFKGHMANIQRLAAEGKLVMAGPMDGVDGWRGIFIFAVPSIDDAKALVATDPVIKSGEMVAEYHKHYGTAALMMVNDWHEKVEKQGF